MEAKGCILFNVLLNRYHPNDTPAFLGTLPKELVDRLAKYKTSSKDTTAAFYLADKRLQRIHPSWLVPVLEQTPDTLRPLFISALPSEQLTTVCRMLKIDRPKLKPPAPVKAFLLSQFMAQVLPEDLLPEEYLPENPINQILTLSKDDLVLVADYMGLRDLAEALRPVVDKKLLQRVHQILTPGEVQMIALYIRQKEKLKVSKLELNKWDGQRDSLRLLYHRRGLIRLAKALSGQSRDLLWHLTRRLDQRRAMIVDGFWSATVVPGVTPLLVQQLVSVIDFVKRQKK